MKDQYISVVRIQEVSKFENTCKWMEVKRSLLFYNELLTLTGY